MQPNPSSYAAYRVRERFQVNIVSLREVAKLPNSGALHITDKLPAIPNLKPYIFLGIFLLPIQHKCHEMFPAIKRNNLK